MSLLQKNILENKQSSTLQDVTNSLMPFPRLNIKKKISHNRKPDGFRALSNIECALSRKSSIFSRHSIINREQMSQSLTSNLKENIGASPNSLDLRAGGSPPMRHELTPCGFHLRPYQIADIDAAKIYSPCDASQYAFYYHQKCIEKECDYMTSPNYLEQNTEISAGMRSMLVDWLVDVQCRYHFNDDALFLAVNILDRYLSMTLVTKNMFLLTGLTCLWIALKMEQQNIPHLKDLLLMTDYAYSSDQFLEKEWEVLSLLSFCLIVPHPLRFVIRLNTVYKGMCLPNQDTLHSLSLYLIHLSLLQVDLLDSRPSQIAAAAVHLASALIDSEIKWDDTWMIYSGGWAESDLKSCEHRLATVLSEDLYSGKNRMVFTIKEKFATEKYGQISLNVKLFAAVSRYLS